MYIPSPSGNGDFEKPEPGTNLAICYQVVDYGTQKSNFNGEVKVQHKIGIYWELPNSLTKEGEPMVIRSRYTLSGHKKSALRRDPRKLARR